MSEAKRRICHVCVGMPREYLCGVCDEGFAREAELRSEISIYQNEYVKYSDLAAAEQRLTEAEKLFREAESWMDTQKYVQPGSVWGELHEGVKKFLTTSGCADGAK